MNMVSSQKRKYELKERAERQEATRRRIVEATVALHEEVGPARTTVAEIARRAGVQRLTVYNHFPEERELFDACGGRFLAAHPRPEFTDALALEDPTARVAEALRRLYAWYRETERMTEKIQRDRFLVPALEERVQQTTDAPFAELAATLAGSFRARGRRAERVAATVRLALDFWTWRRLKLEGLDDERAAALMADTVACQARPA